MKSFQNTLSLQAIKQITGGELIIHRQVEIRSIADPKEADAASIVFFENEKYLPLILATKAGLIVTNKANQALLQEISTNLIIVENPYQAVLYILHYWMELDEADFIPLIHPTAVIGKNVQLPEMVKIGAHTIIEDDCVIGNYTTIAANCSLGRKVQLGEYCHLYPQVSIYEDCSIGNHVTIHSGAVIGADGFGYLLMNGIQQKIPQVGNVIIHDHVEIGANTSIDRGTLSPTIIGEGTKIDNLVQIGHNCIIGKHSILCAQVGLAGSTIVGDYVYLAGQVGVAGHLTIGDYSMVGAQSGVSSDLAPKGKYFGTPTREAQKMKRIMAVENNLPEMYKFVNQLKRDKERE